MNVLACRLNCEDIATLVSAALPADTMWQLALMAVGALREAGGGEEVVAAALGSPLLGMAPFWIRHCSVPFNGPRQSGEDAKDALMTKQNFSVLELELGGQIRKSIPLWVGRSLTA